MFTGGSGSRRFTLALRLKQRPTQTDDLQLLTEADLQLQTYLEGMTR